MLYRTIICPRCEEPVLAGFEETKGMQSSECLNCGLQYENDEIVPSYGITMITYKDGRFEYELLREDPDKSKIEEFKARLTQENIDSGHSYMHVLKTSDFTIHKVA